MIVSAIIALKEYEKQNTFCFKLVLIIFNLSCTIANQIVNTIFFSYFSIICYVIIVFLLHHQLNFFFKNYENLKMKTDSLQLQQLIDISLDELMKVDELKNETIANLYDKHNDFGSNEETVQKIISLYNCNSRK